MKKSEDEKKNNFLFRNAVIVIFISYEILILGNLRHIYIVGEVLNIFCILG